MIHLHLRRRAVHIHICVCAYLHTFVPCLYTVQRASAASSLGLSAARVCAQDENRPMARRSERQVCLLAPCLQGACLDSTILL